MSIFHHKLWPKGKYNGKPIVGGSVKFTLALDFWGIRPRWNMGMPYIVIGPLWIRFEAEYGEYKEKSHE